MRNLLNPRSRCQHFFQKLLLIEARTEQFTHQPRLTSHSVSSHHTSEVMRSRLWTVSEGRAEWVIHFKAWGKSFIAFDDKMIILNSDQKLFLAGTESRGGYPLSSQSQLLGHISPCFTRRVLGVCLGPWAWESRVAGVKYIFWIKIQGFLLMNEVTISAVTPVFDFLSDIKVKSGEWLEPPPWRVTCQTHLDSSLV